MKVKFNFTKNGKTIKTFETLQEAMSMLRRMVVNDISNDILEVQKVENGKVVSYYDLNDEQMKNRTAGGYHWQEV